MLFHNDKRDNNLPAQVVPLLPLRGLAVFPHEVFPISAGRHKSIKALEEAEAQKKPILLAAQKDPKVSEPTPDDIYAVGTLGVVLQLLHLPDGTVKALLEGKKRARIIRHVSDREFFQVEVQEVAEVCERSRYIDVGRCLILRHTSFRNRSVRGNGEQSGDDVDCTTPR
jgi:ATP-dependent Lon protease